MALFVLLGKKNVQHTLLVGNASEEHCSIYTEHLKVCGPKYLKAEVYPSFIHTLS